MYIHNGSGPSSGRSRRAAPICSENSPTRGTNQKYIEAKELIYIGHKESVQLRQQALYDPALTKDKRFELSEGICRILQCSQEWQLFIKMRQSGDLHADIHQLRS